jgi:hypothetical protein
VARDFGHLLDVLESVSQGLAFKNPGRAALETARKSGEVATLSLDTGIEVIGTVCAIEDAHGIPCLVQLEGGPALARDGMLLEGLRCPNDYVVPFGILADGRAPTSLSADDVRRYVDARGRISLTFQWGATVTGTLREVHTEAGQADYLSIEGFELGLSNGRVFRCQSVYPLVLAAAAPSVRAGAPGGYHGATQPSFARVPRPRWLSTRDRRLLALYEEAVEGWTSLGGAALAATFERITAELDRDFAEDWLLRWNLLESLVKAAESGPLLERLERDLELLEVRYAHKQPIATGLATIRAIGGARSEARR